MVQTQHKMTQILSGSHHHTHNHSPVFRGHSARSQGQGPYVSISSEARLLVPLLARNLYLLIRVIHGGPHS
jgi:hypothetical protein